MLTSWTVEMTKLVPIISGIKNNLVLLKKPHKAPILYLWKPYSVVIAGYQLTFHSYSVFFLALDTGRPKKKQLHQSQGSQVL